MAGCMNTVMNLKTLLVVGQLKALPTVVTPCNQVISLKGLTISYLMLRELAHTHA